MLKNAKQVRKESKLRPKEMQRDFEFVGWKTQYDEDGNSPEIEL